jgi:peptidyl-prolyl cis-trans isomerase C
MRILSLKNTFLIGLINIWISGCLWGVKQLPSDTVALVNNYPIKREVIMEQLNFLKNRGWAIKPKIIKQVLDDEMGRRLIIQEAYRMGMDKEPFIKKELQKWIKIQSIIALRNDLAKEKVRISEEEIKREWRKNYEKRRVELIRFENSDKLGKKLLALAQEAPSLYPLFRDHKEELGPKSAFWEGEITRRSFPQFSEQLFSLQKGEVVLLQDNKDSYLVRLIEIPTFTEESLTRLKGEIRKTLGSRKAKEIQEIFIQELRAKAQIEVKEEILAPLEAEELAEREEGFSDHRPLVIVNGEVFTVGDFLKRYKADLPHFRYLTLPLQEKKKKILEALISFAVEAQAAMARNYYLNSPRLQEMAKQHQERTMYNFFYDRIILKGMRISPEELENYYQDHKEHYTEPVLVTLKGILVKEEKKAYQLLEELNAGADFSSLAQIISPSLPREYQEHWIRMSDLPPAVRDSVGQLSIGELSPVVKIPEGFIIFKLSGKREGSPIPLSKIEKRVKKDYLREKGRGAMAMWVKRLKEVAHIKINDPVLVELIQKYSP